MTKLGKFYITVTQKIVTYLTNTDIFDSHTFDKGSSKWLVSRVATISLTMASLSLHLLLDRVGGAAGDGGTVNTEWEKGQRLNSIGAPSVCTAWCGHAACQTESDERNYAVRMLCAS